VSAARRVALFAIATGIALGVGAMVGGALSPLRDGGDAYPMESGHGHAGDAADTGPSGLAVTDGDLTIEPETTALDPGGPHVFRFRIIDATGASVQDMEMGHERLMHLIVASRDMAHYRHVHPDPQADGSWAARLTLPEAGVYRVYADFVRAGRSHILGTDLFVDGALRARPLPAPSDVAAGGAYTATVTDRADGAGVVDLTYRVATASGPVQQIQPYLGAAAHVVALREGDLAVVHAHAHRVPDDPAGLGVAVHAPSAGRYRVFIEFKHDGAVRTVAHTLQVQP
jgi:hypothetical protein